MKVLSIDTFKSGVQNLLTPEIIAIDAASNSKNWITKDGRIVLSNGKQIVGANGTSGAIYGEIFGYKADGTKIHWRKAGSVIQYFNTATLLWVTVITGLTVTADYSFTNYSSLAGTFTFAIGVDGIFKINNAFPTSYLSMYDSSKNFKGLGFIDKGRMLLWNRAEDKTGFYGSKIDVQGVNYTTVASETLGASGSTVYSGTIATYSAVIPNNFFAFSMWAGYGSSKTITAITQAAKGQVTAAGHGYVVGDKLIFTGIVGMTQLNNIPLTVASVVDANNFTLNTNTTSFTAYTSGGTSNKCELFTDNYVGVLTGSNAGTGTINYLTGAYSITFGASTTTSIFSTYKYENSNNSGVTDFSKSATRLAGEGFVFPQDEGGDPIMNILVGFDGYYSMKRNSAYLLNIDTTDLQADNNVYRKDIGIASYRSAIATSKGIIFMDTSRPEKPEFKILRKNIYGGNIEPHAMFTTFSFVNYDYSDCTIDLYDRYYLIACKSSASATNDTILLCDSVTDTVDILSHYARTFARDSGNLYMGSSIVTSVFNLFNGYDDEGSPISNFWTGKSENFGDGQLLNKVAKVRVKGRISVGQSYQIYLDYDGTGPQLVGTILGSGTYVDYSSPQTVGSNLLGGAQLGGDITTDIYSYFTEIKLRKVPKFNTIQVSFIALGYGYADLDQFTFFDIEDFDQRIAAKYRQKQNTGVDGSIDQPTP